MKKKIVAFGLIAAMAVGSTQVAGATTISDAESKKQEAESSLESVNAQITSIEAEQAELQSQIDELDAELVEVLVDIDTTKDDIERKTVELAQVQTDLAEAQATEEEQLNSMKERIRYMYENGDSSFLTALLEADSFAQVLNKLETFSNVYNFDRTLLTEYQETSQQVNDLADEVAVEEADLEELEITLERQQERLEEEKEQKSSEMEDFDAKLAEAESMAAEYRETISEMNDAIAEMQAAQAAAAAAAAEESESGESGGSSGSSSVAYVDAGSSNVSYSSTGGSVVDYACQFIGNPYVWGGESLTNGCDCSGFVMQVYAHFGVSLPHSSESLRYVGTGVSVSSMMPGDIVCYSGHVGIYVGDGTIVNASNSAPYPAGGIKYSSAYYKSILAVRRIFT
ncbi:MAG: NlpC/P60 family protein [Lachnospiraceae bacterium]|nr:NlpC/P60 family protein [Lachnospiraceae bacterium]